MIRLGRSFKQKMNVGYCPKAETRCARFIKICKLAHSICRNLKTKFSCYLQAPFSFFHLSLFIRDTITLFFLVLSLEQLSVKLKTQINKSSLVTSSSQELCWFSVVTEVIVKHFRAEVLCDNCCLQLVCCFENLNNSK